MSRALGEMGAKLAITARDTEELAGAASQHYPHAAWHKVMTLNVDAPFVLTREVARRSMIARCAGRVINISSITGLLGNPARHAHHRLQ